MDCGTYPDSPGRLRAALNRSACNHLGPGWAVRPHLYSPSVFSRTVLCFTKATSPASSTRHLCRKSQEPEWVPATALRPIYLPSWKFDQGHRGDPRGHILQFCSFGGTCSQTVGCVALPSCGPILAPSCVMWARKVGGVGLLRGLGVSYSRCRSCGDSLGLQSEAQTPKIF